MRAKISLRARVAAGKFVTLQFVEGKIIVPPGTTSYYARFSENGKRYSKPLGKDIGVALDSYRKLVAAREKQSPLQFDSQEQKLAEARGTLSFIMADTTDLNAAKFLAYRALRTMHVISTEGRIPSIEEQREWIADFRLRRKGERVDTWQRRIKIA